MHCAFSFSTRSSTWQYTRCTRSNLPVLRRVDGCPGLALPRPPAGSLGSGQGLTQWAPGKESAVELRLNASSDCAARERAIVSERKRGLRASEMRRVARTCALNARHKRASGISSRYAKARHLPSAVMAGRGFATARTRGMLCRAGLDSMGSRYASVSKSTMIVVVIAPCCIGAVFHRYK